MILKEIKYTRFSYKFKNPFRTSCGTLEERKGFFITMIDNLAYAAVGECSPLPGFSSESYSEVEKFLSNELDRLVMNEIENTPERIRQTASEITKLPSVRFAIEQAMLELAMQHDKNFLRNNFGIGKKNIPVNAVIGFDKPENVLSKISDKYKNGYKTFKIKVGRENFSDDLEIVKLIRKKFSDDVAIRLDANGRWDIDNAVNNLARLSGFDIEYIEEPCSNPSCLMKLAEHSKIPIALDESLKTFRNAIHLINASKIEFLIVKPMILGGIIDAVQLINQAKEQGKKIIISSSFETQIGKRVLVFLAALTSHNFAHGLDTAGMFDKSPIPDPFPVKDSNIIFDPECYPQYYDTGQLT